MQTDSTAERVRVYASSTPEYHAAFRTFLACTDQKEKAMAHLDREIMHLGRRKNFVDVGAGTGKLTAHFARMFEVTTAIEPNPSLVSELRSNCPGVCLVESVISEALVDPDVDFVLCSHVFYYLHKNTWLISLEKMASWLAHGGVLAVALQNADTDCMRMLHHFLGERFDLSALASEFAAQTKGRLTVSLTTIPAVIKTSSLEEAYCIAEFMLNLLPIANPPRSGAVKAYVKEHFHRSGAFDFSCDQDFLRVQRVSP
jgi:SAM-dependent methyltransferase